MSQPLSTTSAPSSGAAGSPVPKEVNAFLNKGTEFEGKLTFEGTVRIDGKCVGEIFSDNVLIIGDTGVVDAEIHVDTVVVMGEVNGNITAKSRIELKRSGKIRGNVRTQSLVIEEGALFEGSCSMGGEATKAAKPMATAERKWDGKSEGKGEEKKPEGPKPEGPKQATL